MKYNRRTPKEKQEKLSIDAKIELILKFGNMNEIFNVIKKNFEIVKRVFDERIKNDLMMSKKSRNLIKYIIYLKSQKLGQI